MAEEKQDIINEFEEILGNANNGGNLSEVEKNSETEKLKVSKDQLKRDALGIKNTKYCFNGGARPGSGMKKGQVTKKTMDERMAAEYIRTRVKNSLSKLIDSQMNLARGCQYLFKIKKQYDEKNQRWFTPKNTKPEIVKDKEEMAKYLAGEFDDKQECDYYFLTSEKPDNKALDSLLDRTLGKATQRIEGNLGVSISDLLDELE